MGGGGSSDDYTAQQAQQEAKKAAARSALNAAFGVGTDGALTDDAAANKAARDTLYSTVRDNAFAAGKRSLDERNVDAQRNNKFALYAQGLQGGSVDIDENALLNRTYQNGLLDLGGKADATKADLKGNDEQTRLQLLQSIDAGMDQNSALSSALGQLQVNGDKATAAAQGTSLGDLFADSGALYTKSQAARGKQYAVNNNPYSYFTGSRARNSGASGVISTIGT
jgi:hypothetical protein